MGMKAFNENPGSAELTSPVAEAIKTLWADEGVQVAYGRRDEYQLIDSAKL